MLGLGVLLIGATSVFGELQQALDRIWRAPVRTASLGLWGLLRVRLLSFGMILGLAFLLRVSLGFGAMVTALGTWWGSVFGGWHRVAQGVNLLIGLVLTTVLFVMIYKLMPRVRVDWHDVFLGAVVTALLFTVGKYLIGLYIGRSGVASTFGAAVSLVGTSCSRGAGMNGSHRPSAPRFRWWWCWCGCTTRRSLQVMAQRQRGHRLTQCPVDYSPMWNQRRVAADDTSSVETRSVATLFRDLSGIGLQPARILVVDRPRQLAPANCPRWGRISLRRPKSARLLVANISSTDRQAGSASQVKIQRPGPGVIYRHAHRPPSH